MAQKRDLWHMDVALATFYMGRFTPTPRGANSVKRWVHEKW